MKTEEQVYNKKMELKEKMIELNYHLSMAMIREDSGKIWTLKWDINNLMEEYLGLIELPI